MVCVTSSWLEAGAKGAEGGVRKVGSTRRATRSLAFSQFFSFLFSLKKERGALDFGQFDVCMALVNIKKNKIMNKSRNISSTPLIHGCAVHRGKQLIHTRLAQTKMIFGTSAKPPFAFVTIGKFRAHKKI